MNVQCSWKVSDGRPISDAVFYSREMNDVDLEDEINVENCVFLKAPDKCEGLYPTVPACQLLICCEAPNQITRISAICEARVIEVYGHHGEYIKTIFNTPLEDSENLFVYRGDVKLEKPLSICSIKFVNLESQNEMWLFGVKIHTEKATYSPEGQGISIPFAAFQQKLEESMKDSNENKDSLKQFSDQFFKMGLASAFQQLPTASSFRAINENLPPPNFNNLMQGLANTSNRIQGSSVQNSEECEQNVIKGELTKDFTDSNSNLQPIAVNRVVSSVSTSPALFTSESTATQTEEDYINLEEKLKAYVDEKIQAIDKRFSEIEAKIMCKLDEIESFVKPQGVQSN